MHPIVSGCAMNRLYPRARTILLGCALAGAAVVGYSSARREALFVVVQGCIAAETITGMPFPCAVLDRGTVTGLGTAVLRQPLTATHAILVPLAAVRGIEAPLLQGEAGLAYWNAALKARAVVVAASGGVVAADAVGLAVNSAGGRSQDQLHIHLDCVQPSLWIALRDWLPPDGAGWRLVPTPIDDARYLARWISAQDMARFNPFAAVAAIADWRTDLRNVSFAAIELSAAEGGGWVVLAQHAGASSAEHVLDPFCARERPRSAAEGRLREN